MHACMHGLQCVCILRAGLCEVDSTWRAVDSMLSLINQLCVTSNH